MSAGERRGEFPLSEIPGKLWIGYCDICNGQHCVTIRDDDVTRIKHRTIPDANESGKDALRARIKQLEAWLRDTPATAAVLVQEERARVAEARVAALADVLDFVRRQVFANMDGATLDKTQSVREAVINALELARSAT